MGIDFVLRHSHKEREKSMTSESIFILLAIIAYLGITVGIGVYYSKKGSTSDTAGFYLGGERS